MNRPEKNDPLRELISDAVSDVEPADGLESIRNRTKVTSMSTRRPWIYGAGGAIVATAAVITAIAFAGNFGDGDSADPGPAGSSSAGTTDGATDDVTVEDPSAFTTEGETDPADPPAVLVTVPVYYIGDGPGGSVLFREFTKLRPGSGQSNVEAALGMAVSGTPMDPDYRQPWPDGTKVDTTAETMQGDVIVVPLLEGGTPLHDRPDGMSERDAQLAIEQLVYTAQAAVGKGRLPVQILLDGEHSDTVLGVPTSEPLANADVLDTLSLMNVTAPVEGAEVSGSFTATGVNNSFESNVQWQVLKGDKVVKDGFGTAEGWGMDRLFPWKVKVDVSGLAPGEYTFKAMNDDPTGGAEGNGPDVDTKTIVVK
ncbi:MULTISPECIES: Gmad2 immunoglobulin-like domain-containing protein [unclassified Nocardioides]|uniref:Gmad2 immunoglobulin-like domain-containing protein n=1 Tax=unclassified Nocardioides TaxID=2615069 RepID=UPI0006F4991B|nr:MULTISPECIES: Gmad2 immunoglobulin-like domain-containing protein [unclassified Nocardioides]KQY54591.1 hypothetical protein ASD30_18280 [Nocardioides sp. Root140]KQZ66465.1 hypothetical protein ASD66_23365 [Nocardioides sp. Root151]KRF19688.1 hypothetical protein ASH02_24340 [Nocardioides sp. Soil796]